MRSVGSTDPFKTSFGASGKARNPRYRSRFRYDSFTFPQGGFSIVNGKLVLSKIGHIKIVQHRPTEGTVKTATIKRSPTGKWFVSIVCEFEPKALPLEIEAAGIDAGLKTFATLSTGDTVANPKFFRKEEKELAKVQRKLSKTARKSAARKRRKQIAARVHERIANKRHNFVHQESRKIIDRFQFVAVENLKVNNMLKNHCLAKSIADAAWSMFFYCLNYKAEWAGRTFEKVPPHYTSQRCSRCHHKQDMPLDVRLYQCSNPGCGLVLDRDLNASLNILSLGLQACRPESRRSRRA